MDDLLQARLEVYEAMDAIDPRIPSYLRAMVQELSQAMDVDPTDDNFGMLVSHFAMALDRAMKGQGETEAPAESLLADISLHAPSAMSQAEGLSQQMSELLGINLTASEVSFLALHLGTLAITHARRRKRAKSK